MRGALINEYFQVAVIYTGTTKDRGQFAYIVDHALIAIRTACLGCSSGEENSFRPALDLAALPDHLAIGCPQRRTFEKKPAEYVRTHGCRVKRNQGAQRRSAQSGVFRTSCYAVISRHKWHDFLDQKIWIAIALCAHDHGMHRPVRHVFPDAIFGSIINPYHDHGRHRAFSDEPVGRLVDLPFHAGKGSCRLEQVLAIVQIEDRVAAAGILWIVVSGGQPYAQKARVVEDAAVKFVQAQVSGCPLGTDYARLNPGALIFSFLDFF